MNKMVTRLVVIFLIFSNTGFSANSNHLNKHLRFTLVSKQSYSEFSIPEDCPANVSNNTISPSSYTICGSGSAIFTGQVPSATSYTDSSYQWQFKTTTGSWTDISNATQLNYTTAILTETTLFRRLVYFIGCSTAYPSDTITIIVNPIPTTPSISVQNNCGESVLTASNYTGTLEWSTGETTESITVNDAGGYSLTQTVAGCASEAASANANPKTIPTLDVSPNNPTDCQGLGSLDFTFTGVDDGAYTITYATDSFTNVTVSSGAASVQASAGTYNNLTITVDGCTSAAEINASLSDPDPPTTPSISVQNNCGESVLTASNYTGTLEWSTGETTESITVNDAGGYSLTQTVAGCTSEAASANANPKTIPTLDVSPNNPTDCLGPGSLDFTFTGVDDGAYTITYATDSFTNVTVSSGAASVQASAGTYNNLTITVDGCKSAAEINASLSDPNPPNAPSISVQNNCGESVLTASNYTGTLEWSTGETTESITVNDAGGYSLTQTVAGCTSEAASANANPKTIPTLDVSPNNPTDCQGLGSLDFTFTGVDDGAYTITYATDSFTNVTVSSGAASVQASAGTYNNLTITVDGCKSAAEINANLSDPNPPNAPTISVNDNCGESVLTASNYTGTLEWSIGETTESITVNDAGGYSLTQTINGCTGNAATATAAPKVIPTLSVSENNPTTCQGLGSLDFTFTGVDDGAYTITYASDSFQNVTVSSGAASVQASAGTYNNLTITVDGCKSAAEINASLSDPNPPTTPSISVLNNCGESVLTASNYTGTLEWSTGETTESITVNDAGGYSLTQTVAGCTSEAASANANPKTIPTLDVSPNNPTDCQGLGSLDFTFTGVDDGAYTITYATDSFTNVTVSSGAASVQASAGTYNNLTINVNGCKSTAEINASLSDPNPPTTPSISVLNNCGESVLTASNYTGTLEWSTGETTESITVNDAGGYSLTQTVAGCTSEAASASANPKTIPTLDASPNNPTDCQGLGSLDFTFTGVDDGAYTITYASDSFQNVTVSSGAASVQASAGTYNNLTITVDGCKSAAEINASLSDPNPPTTPSISVLNNCGESVLTASNYTGTLEWSTGETTESITVNDAGGYSFTQTVAGCTSEAASANANPKTIPTLDVSPNNPTDCQGLGSLDFTFTGVDDGVYTITYATDSFQNVTVSSGAASVQASAGTYNNLTITVDGCKSADEINASLSDPNPPTTPSISVQNNCGESVLTASNYTGTLEWSTGETTESITVNDAGGYSLTQTINGCTGNAATATAAPKVIPTLSVSENNPTTCQGLGSLDFTTTGVPDRTYTISYDGSFFTNVIVSNNFASKVAAARAYNNLTISVNGCTSAMGVNARLYDPDPPNAPTISVNDNCGESILTASNYSGALLWSTGETTESITVNNAAEYSLAQTVNECTSEVANITASPKEIPKLDVTATNPTVCQGKGSLDFTLTEVADGAYTITYDGGSFSGVIISNGKASVQTTARTYNNIKITVDGCTSANGINAVLSDPNPPATPTISAEDRCGESVLTASNYTGTLNWDTGESTQSIIVYAAREYTLTQRINGCTSNSASALANPKPIPTLSVSPTIATSCQGLGIINFTFTDIPDGTYTVIYDTGSFSNVEVSGNMASVEALAGTYTNLKITNNNCRSASGVNTTLTIPDPPEPPIITIQNYCGESVLTASNYTGNLLWSTGDTTQSITVNTAGEYTLTQTINGCTSTAAFAIANPGASAPAPDIVVENSCGESSITITNRMEDAWLVWESNTTKDSTQNDVLTFTKKGNYSFYQKLQNCISSATTITVNPKTIPSPPITSNKEVCATDPIQSLLAVADAPDNNTSVIWYDSATGGNVIEEPFLDTIGTITYYAESINSTTGCASNERIPAMLTIKNLPLTLSDTSIIDKPHNNAAVLIFPDDSLKYQWYLNNDEITNATNQYYYIFESDRKNGNVFTIEVELQNGCKAKFNYIYSGHSLNAATNSFNQSGLSNTKILFTIYPNPSNTNFNIAIDTKQLSDIENLSVKVFTVNGACIMDIPLRRTPQKIETEHINPGLYSVVLYTNQQRLQAKKLTITQH